MRDSLLTVWGRIKKDLKEYGMGFLVAAGLYFLLHQLFNAFCPSVIVTGFPCPGCGMTRAILYLLQGQVKRSFMLNPAASLWIAWALCFAGERYIAGRSSKKLLWAAGGIILFMAAVYICRMVLYFPDRPPYVYTKDNFLSHWVPGYGQIVKKLVG